MVGLVLVSHSKKLAEAAQELVLQMTAPDFPIAVASGVGETHDELGTDAVHISEILQSLNCPEGVLVLMDLGSAVLSAETAIELLDPPDKPIRLCAAPFARALSPPRFELKREELSMRSRMRPNWASPPSSSSCNPNPPPVSPQR